MYINYYHFIFIIMCVALCRLLSTFCGGRCDGKMHLRILAATCPSFHCVQINAFSHAQCDNQTLRVM